MKVARIERCGGGEGRDAFDLGVDSTDNVSLCKIVDSCLVDVRGEGQKCLVAS